MEQDQRQQKQQYLREEILEKEYNPEEFVIFLNSKLKIGDNLDLCTFSQLKEVVQEFISMKTQQTIKKNQSSIICEDIGQSQSSQNIIPEDEQKETQKSPSYFKPKQLLFTKNTPNILEMEYSNGYRCTKLIDKFEKQSGNITCEVHTPQRKQVGGLFGIGSTSFLQFKVTTRPMGWEVGRRYSDFIWLRNHLLKVYPTYIIPPIPEKKASKKTQRHLQKRMRILSYFLNDLAAEPLFRNDQYVLGFLSTKQNNAFQSLKKDQQKVKPFQGVSSLQNEEGVTEVKLTEENKVFLDQMEKLIPKTEKTYKSITRCGKQLQNLFTQEVNTMYEIGNYFAELHEDIRNVLNRIPMTQSLKKLNDIYITVNNMMIEWGNIVRNQQQMIEKNWSTFFKYVRNEVRGFSQLHKKQTQIQLDYAKTKLNLEKKKQKIYALHDPSRWQLKNKDIASVPKQAIHDKSKAFQLMLPKETADLQVQKHKLFFYINQHHINGNRNYERAAVKFSENFNEFVINMKVNNQQMGEMWSEMAVSFSDPSKKVIQVKTRPIFDDKSNEVLDD